MGTTIHIFDYQKTNPPLAPINVVFGDEAFLRHLALASLRDRALQDNDVPFAQYDGDSVEWRDVSDELQTVSLFNAGGQRLVIVREADPFVTQNRGALEEYAQQPERNGLLILDVKKWPSNTRLFKRLDKTGLQIACRAPMTGRGKQQSVDTNRVVSWLNFWAKTRHQISLPDKAARQLLELIGPEFGLLDQEIAKLALYVDPNSAITAELVRKHGGGWRTRTVWELLDAALSGNTANAVTQLDRLFQAGQDPNALFGPLSWSLRRFAAATRIYQRAERQGRRIALPKAMEEAGFPTWQRDAMRTAEQQLKQLGRQRAGQMYRWLLELDLALKSTHSSPMLARLAVEQLLLRMSLQMRPPRR